MPASNGSKKYFDKNVNDQKKKNSGELILYNQFEQYKNICMSLVF